MMSDRWGFRAMPSPFIVEIAIEPKSQAGRATLKLALRRLLGGDALLSATEDEECGQTVIRGTDESHLRGAVDQLRRDVGELFDVGAPQVAYRESLARKVDVDYTHKKQSGGSGQFGRIKLTVEPGKPGQGVIFVDEVYGSNIPREYIPSVEKGVRQIANTGSLIGFPIVDFTATLTDGAYHDVDSSALAFEIAGRGAMREAAQKAGIKLLEPIMKIAVLAPPRCLSAIITDLATRWAEIQVRSEDSTCAVIAAAPMARLFGYEASLATMSQGEARMVMLLDHYAEVPPSVIGPDDTFPAAAALRA